MVGDGMERNIGIYMLSRLLSIRETGWQCRLSGWDIRRVR